MKPVLLSTFLVVLMALFLSACGPAATPTQPLGVPAATPTQPPSVPATAAAPATVQQTTESSTRTDEQGAVVVEVIPLNLDNPGQTLDFQVSLNTHSIDLSMDLATLATLTTDTGVEL